MILFLLPPSLKAVAVPLTYYTCITRSLLCRVLLPTYYSPWRKPRLLHPPIPATSLLQSGMPCSTGSETISRRRR
jgi:hypothetical protein